MSTGKLRRDHSGSQERHSRREADKRSETSRRGTSPSVQELSEEEYDEGWEHEWEDIDEIGRGETNYRKTFTKHPHQKWRGKTQFRGQNRPYRWDHRNHSADSDISSEGVHKMGRRVPPDEDDEGLDMPAGVEMTNLKVKIQDGKRFAEPDEIEEADSGSRPYPRFSRGRRGYHSVGRDRFVQGNRFKLSPHDDRLDCREVLNRRKRHHPDPGESDLREKLLRKDVELGDLREIIEARDAVAAELRDIIEPPDPNAMDEFIEDVVGEVDLVEDINLRIENDYYDGNHEGSLERERSIEKDEIDAETESYRFEEDQDAIHNIPPDDMPLAEETDPQLGTEERLHQERRHFVERRFRERNFDRGNEWSGRGRRREGPWRCPRSPGSAHSRVSRSRSRSLHSESGFRRRNQEHGRQRSREIVGSPLRPPRERSFERIVRQRAPAWQHDSNFDDVSRRRYGGRRSFDEEVGANLREDDGRPFSPDPVPPIDGRRLLRSPFMRSDHESERSIGMVRDRRSTRSISQEVPRGDRRRRSISGDRGRMISQDRSLVRERNDSQGPERYWDIRDEPRDEGRESKLSVDRMRKRIPSSDRNRNFDPERKRSFDRDRKRSPVMTVRTTRWDRSRSLSRSPGPSSSTRVQRGPEWGGPGPRTPSEDSYRGVGWERTRSPDRGRPRSLVRERSRSRGLADHVRDHSRELQGRGREQKEKAILRPKEPDRREKHLEPPNRRALLASPHRPREPGPASFRSLEKEPSVILKGERNRKREQDEDLSKDQGRGRPMSPNLRSQPDKIVKKTPEVLIQEFKDKYLKNIEKPDKYNRRDDFPPKPMRNSISQQDKLGAALNQEDSREWENIRDIQERRTAQPVVGLPFLEEARRQREREQREREQREREQREREQREREQREREQREKEQRERDQREREKEKEREKQREKEKEERHKEREKARVREREREKDRERERERTREREREKEKQRENTSRALQPRNQGIREPRALNLPMPFIPQSHSQPSSVKLDQAGSWSSQDTRPSFNHQEDERRRHSRWGSPSRREKRSDVPDGHRAVQHSSLNATNPHLSSSNGKADDNFWRRNLPSPGDSQWNKPRSDLSSNPPRDASIQRPPQLYSKSNLSPKEVIFVRGLARDVDEMDIRKNISECGLWPKDVRIVHDNDTGASRGIAFVTFNSVDEATRWMDVRGGVLNLRPNNHAAMDYSNPVSRDWECVRCHITNFKHRSQCYQCNRPKDDCLDGWEETCPYPTNALLLRGLNPLTSTSEIIKALKSRMVSQARLDGVKMGVDLKGRPRSVCFVQLTSVVDSVALHKSLTSDPLIIENSQVMVAYCNLDKLPPMDSHAGLLHPTIQVIPPANLTPAVPAPIALNQNLPSNNIPVVTRTSAPVPPPPKPAGLGVSTASIRSMLEGNYTEKDIPTLAQYCASAYAKNPQEQAAYVKYYTKLYKEKLLKAKTGIN